MSVIEASIELDEHDERDRGVPLVLARIRLVTDRGYFTADGEGYGAIHAPSRREHDRATPPRGGDLRAVGEASPSGERERLYGRWLGG